MTRRTKIVATIGPSVDTKEGLAAMVGAGMNVARFNCSHGEWDQKRRWHDWLREVEPKDRAVGILLDLQGPKFRLGELPPEGVNIAPGEEVTIGPGGQLPLHEASVLAVLEPGKRLLFGDGDVEIRILEPRGENYVASVTYGGLVRSRQGVTMPGQSFDATPLQPKDYADLAAAAAIEPDFIALSYVRTAADLRVLREELGRLGLNSQVCAKIETAEACANLDEIVAEADLLMVARGDLGLQIELSEVPIQQKRIIRACLLAGKPVITATQMLESMVSRPRPTRAEANDVANAILDGTDAVMLSGETAIGQFPVHAVRTMVEIAEVADAQIDRGRIRTMFETADSEVMPRGMAIAEAAASLARQIHATAIVVTTTSGQTARLVSRFRPRRPILCASWEERTRRSLSVVWGVDPVTVDRPTTTEQNVVVALSRFRESGALQPGDLVVVTAGAPAGKPGNTNLITVARA